MKRFIGLLSFVLIGFGLSACIDDEPTDELHLSYRAIDSVQVERINPPREITEFKIYSTKKNSCEELFDYDYVAFQNQRTVKLVVAEVIGDNCTQEETVAMTTLQFRPENNGTYTFYFWNGFDEDGEPMYLTEEIVIPLL